MIELNYEAAKEGGGRRPPSGGTMSERGSLLRRNALMGASRCFYCLSITFGKPYPLFRIMLRRCALSVTQQQVLEALAGQVAARRGADRTPMCCRDRGQRRQGVLLDQCRRRRGARMGRPCARRPKRRAGASRRCACDDRAHRRTQGGRAAPPPRRHRMRQRGTGVRRSPRTGRRKIRAARRWRARRKFPASPP